MQSKREKCLNLFLYLANLALVVPVMIGTGYTYLCEDDFSFESGAADLAVKYGSTFLGAVHAAIGGAKWSEGTWFGTFMIHFITPYTRWRLPGYHFVMFLQAFFFAWGLYYLTSAIAKRKTPALALTFAGLAAAFLMVGRANDELFFWYTGSMFYTMELSMAMFAAGSCLRYYENLGTGKAWKYLALSCVLGFLVGGGMLEVVSPNCAWLLLIFILCGTVEKKRWQTVIPFLSALAGALLNVIQPGNYMRSEEDMVEGHVTALDALRDGVVCYINESKTMLSSPLFWLFFAFVFCVAVIFAVKVRPAGMTAGWLGLALLAVVLIQYFTIFPVVFGYHGDSLKTYRTSATYGIVGRWMWMLFAACLGQWVSEHLHGRKALVPAAAAFAAAVIFAGIRFPQTVLDVKQGFSYCIAADLYRGNIQRTYDVRQYVISEMEMGGEDEDVILFIDRDISNRSMYGMGLVADCGWVVNESAARLFHVRTVTVIYE